MINIEFMITARHVLYTLWALVPVAYFLIALWTMLENIGKKEQRKEFGWYIIQGAYLTCAVGISVAIDQFLLEDLATRFSPAALPLLVYQVLLFPAVLLVASKIIGGSKPIEIDHIPRLKNKK